MQGNRTVNSAIAVAFLAASFAAAGEEPSPSRLVEGNLRVQALSPTLVRIETGVDGKFVDEPTHFAVERRWPGASLEKKDDGYLIAGKHLVRIRDGGPAVVVEGRERPVPVQAAFDWPDRAMPVVAFRDEPQLIPAPWGATPPPQAGPVVEVNLPAADIRQAREAVLEVVHYQL